MRPAVVVVVDGEGADVVAAVGEAGDDVAVLLAGGEREVAEGLLLGVPEPERLRDDGHVAAGEVAVGEPRGVEGIGGVGRPAAVNAVGKPCTPIMAVTELVSQLQKLNKQNTEAKSTEGVIVP